MSLSTTDLRLYCDPIRSPAPEMIYEERLWIEVVPMMMIAFITFKSSLVPLFVPLDSF